MAGSDRGPKESASQARLLADCWARSRKLPVSDGYNLPTTLVCVKHGWLRFNGTNGTFASGATYAEHEISPSGLLALEQFFRDARLKAACV